MFFSSFPFSKKSGRFFARLVTRNFTRALGTPSARFRMGRATRDALNARRTQHGTQSTRDAVNVGRCQRGTLSTQAAVKGDGCQGRGDITVGNHHFKIQMGISFRLWTQGLVIVRWALIMQLKATTIVSLTMQPHYLYSATFRPQLVQICLENVFL